MAKRKQPAAGSRESRVEWGSPEPKTSGPPDPKTSGPPDPKTGQEPEVSRPSSAASSSDGAAATPGASLPTSTAQLTGDAANPRKISDEAAAGLGASIKRFGDLSGIVFNQRTGELVAGHRRMEQIRAAVFPGREDAAGDLPIEVIDASVGLYGIRVDESHFFPVRVVDWSKAKQRAANVAANNQKLQGTFTKELSTYLLEIEAEASAELPGVFDECLLTELMAEGINTRDTAEEVSFTAQAVPDVYQVVVECDSEEKQKAVYDQLVELGYEPKLLTM